jgi:pimeloyl-ACP methyl ester carboxylesterase
MALTRKRLVTGLLILLVVISGWFYWFYFMSTNAAIRHAESFLFRRMIVSQVDVEGTYRHFFITNRRFETGGAPVEDRYTSDLGEGLSFGTFDTRMQPSLGLGMLLDSTDWFQNEEIRITDVSKLDSEDMLEQLRNVVDRSSGRSLLIVIHGFRERFSSALRKTAFVASVLDIDTPVLVFDWPANQGSSLRGYRASRELAVASGADLARALEVIVSEIQPDNLALVANSMGGEVVVSAFNLLYENPDFADSDVEIDHVVLTAPDVDHTAFNEQFKHEIKAFAEDLTVYVSSNDRALLISRLINRGERVGESTLSPDMLDEAVMISRLVDPDSDLISLVDVTPVNRTRNFHNFSLETPEFYDDLYLRLTAEERAPRSRRLYRVRTPDDSEYWVLTRGR